MNQNIKKSNAIIYTIIAAALIVFLAIWPTGLIHQTYISKSDEMVATESGPVNVEHNLTQMFVAENDNLSAVNLYVTNDMQGETITFRLYDASYSELFNTFYVVKTGQKLPGFIHIPVGYELIKDQEYYYTIEGLSTDLYVNLEDTQESTSIVNGILAYSGEELPGYNVIIRYEYTNTFPWYLILLSALVLGGFATVFSFGVRKLYQNRIQDKEISVQRLLQFTCNPIIVVVAGVLLYLVFPGRIFGTGIVNYIFYYLGIILFAVFLLYVLNSKWTGTKPMCTMAGLKDHFTDYLQALCFAGVLWSCYEYWNGLYDIHHAYATCKVLCYFFLAIIVTYRKKELLNLVNLIYLVVSVVVAYFYAKPYIGVEEQGELHKLQAYVIVIGGFVLVNSVRIIIEMIKKQQYVRPSLSYSILVILLFIGMIIFRNTRTWPVLTAVMIVLFVLRMSVWDKRDRLSRNLCMGIILNFIIAVIYCLLHRPYHAYIYYRYGMMFHTVTVTAEYLTLVLGAAIVQFLKKYKESIESDEKNRVAFMWKELLLFGTAAVYMFLTLSRTGFFAVVAMLAVILTMFTINCLQEQSKMNLAKVIITMFAAFIFCFPTVFSFTRMLPALTNEPIRSEVEETEVSIRKGEAKDSMYYMSLNRFLEVAGIKLFNQKEQSTIKEIKVLKISGAYVSAGNEVDSEDVTINDNQEEDKQADFSNGRIELFYDYKKEWNLTGHEEMGVMMKNGEVAVHAHNSFLQAIHDFGLIIGIYIILFGAFTFMFGANNFRTNWKKDMYCLLTPVIIVGFCAAGMAEWMFHICNPMGFALFMSIIPILFSNNKGKI